MLIFFVLYSGEDESVIYKLFKENNLFLYNVAKNILGNKDDAEDVVQETFCRLSVNIDKIRKLQEEKRISYAVVMVKNFSFNIINAKKRETLFDDCYMNIQNFSSQDTGEERVLHKEEIEGMQAIIAALPVQEKELLHMRWLEMSYKEIGEMLQISEATARKRMERVLKKMRKKYEGGGL